ncbi:ABC transporter [Bacillus sp. FJAT-47783]|uniref:ABC transporter n=1 Tax=Bacillus sp. FJAT-47783 TaxID=2922712 RepID=UPI001FAC7500|nr:ABC transporter [Bacillus sp. FJAT-47783]
MLELKEILKDWEEKLDKDEWYFRNSFEKLTEGMSSQDAFNYIPTVVNELLQLKTTFLIGEVLDLLHILYSKADTTEIHTELREKICKIERLVAEYGDEYSRNSLFELKKAIRIN